MNDLMLENNIEVEIEIQKFCKEMEENKNKKKGD
jgi:hypothetical protein